MEKISLVELGMEGTLRVRKDLSGALILEVPGADSGGEVVLLAGRFQLLAAEKGESFLIWRPVKLVTLRIRGIEKSLSAAKIVAAVAETSDC